MNICGRKPRISSRSFPSGVSSRWNLRKQSRFCEGGAKPIFSNSQSQLDRMGEELRALRSSKKAEKSGGRLDNPCLRVYFPMQADLRRAIADLAAAGTGCAHQNRFDLSDQMLSPLRRQAAPPPALRRPQQPAETIRTVVKQFVAAHPRTQDVKPPAYQPSVSARLKDRISCPAKADRTADADCPDRPADIESYCKPQMDLY